MTLTLKYLRGHIGFVHEHHICNFQLQAFISTVSSFEVSKTENLKVVRHVGLSTSCLSSNTVRNNMSLLLTIIANMLTERNMTFVFTSRLSSESKCKINVVAS